MAWGGLRGAVGLALALYLNNRVQIFTAARDHEEAYGHGSATAEVGGHSSRSLSGAGGAGRAPDWMTAKDGERLLFHVSGIALLTLIINGTSAGG
jgi:hypothetical protein